MNKKLSSVFISGSLILIAWLGSIFGLSRLGFDLLMTVAAIIAGLPVLKEAWNRLRVRQFSIPLLVSIAAIGALWIGETWEAAAVTFLYILGGFLENLTLSKTRTALRELIDQAPKTARVKQGEEIIIVSPDMVKPGDIVVVLPGDRVPVDGTVTNGQAVVDTAAITGEPLPLEVAVGTTVLGGSVSQSGYLEVKALRVGADTTFNRLIYMVAEAQEQKPQAQRFLDRFARWYTPTVIGTAILVYLFTKDIRLSLTFLVIGCPGALVVAAPVATVAGLGHAARQGILIKGGERLERIGKVDVVAFDKTGTLTQGKPEVATVISFDSEEPKQVVALAATAELRSEHHLAQAILTYAREQDVEPLPAIDWKLEPGLGAVAETKEGEILVGNRRLLATHGVILTADNEAQVVAREALGETVALVALAGKPVGLLGITDRIRPEAERLVPALQKAGIQQTVMLTGDNQAAAKLVGEQLGVDEIRAGLVPADKVAALKEVQAKGHTVAMVGDGIYDAPALATADISIAMGVTGTQVAIETADITLMTDRLLNIPYAIGLSRQILRVIRQNVVLAVAVVLFLLGGVITGHIYLASGMLIHEASLLLVIANGMRLLKPKNIFREE